MPGHGTVEEKGARMSGLENVSTKRRRIAELAKRAPDMCLTSLAHHIDLEWLEEAYRQTRKDGARGVDGQSAQEYAANLEQNLRDLLERAKSGRYQAPPVRRVYVPKGDGKEQRPIGIPTFEDKVLQRAVAMVLESVYEQDFLDCSYGFRPGRSAHQALETLRTEAMTMAGGWVIEIDIRKYFDEIDHRHMQGMIRQRVGDGVLTRLIGKWLNAGVMEDGAIHHPDAGSPQGGVISPIIANVYLHAVLDKWFEHEIRPRMRGRVFMIRYADDAVLGFEHEEDAQRVMAVLAQRFGRFGLRLHPEKTRLVWFGSPNRRARPDGKEPDTFDFLGLTHYWGKTRRGLATIKRRTASSRLRRALQRIALWCRGHRHEPIREQQRQLNQKLRGHYGYYGIRGNSAALARFWWQTQRLWYKWVSAARTRGLV
jgi:RNA-directed DNA polymerase